TSANAKCTRQSRHRITSMLGSSARVKSASTKAWLRSACRRWFCSTSSGTMSMPRYRSTGRSTSLIQLKSPHPTSSSDAACKSLSNGGISSRNAAVRAMPDPGPETDSGSPHVFARYAARKPLSIRSAPRSVAMLDEPLRDRAPLGGLVGEQFRHLGGRHRLALDRVVVESLLNVGQHQHLGDRAIELLHDLV